MYLLCQLTLILEDIVKETNKIVTYLMREIRRRSTCLSRGLGYGQEERIAPVAGTCCMLLGQIKYCHVYGLYSGKVKW